MAISIKKYIDFNIFIYILERFMRIFLLNYMLTHTFLVELHLKIRDLLIFLRILREKSWEKVVMPNYKSQSKVQKGTFKKPTAAIRKPRDLIVNRPWKLFLAFLRSPLIRKAFDEKIRGMVATSMQGKHVEVAMAMHEYHTGQILSLSDLVYFIQNIFENNRLA